MQIAQHRSHNTVVRDVQDKWAKSNCFFTKVDLALHLADTLSAAAKLVDERLRNSVAQEI